MLLLEHETVSPPPKKKNSYKSSKSTDENHEKVSCCRSSWPNIVRFKFSKIFFISYY